LIAKEEMRQKLQTTETSQ